MYQHPKQHGVVLVISLIVLLLLTLIGMASLQTSTLEEKIAGNFRHRHTAFQSAEAALSAGEFYISKHRTALFNCTHGLFKPRDSNCDGIQEATDVWENTAIWHDNTKSITYNNDKHEMDTDTPLSRYPHYIIEEIDAICTVATRPCPVADQQKTYRITARATGSSSDSVIMLQSIYSPF